MDQRFARAPDPPYVAVIFTSLRRGADDGYDTMAETMHALALAEAGCLGVTSLRDTDGFGVTISYWPDAATARAWKSEARHLAAQRRGATEWYAAYRVEVAVVERAYDGPRELEGSPRAADALPPSLRAMSARPDLA